MKDLGFSFHGYNYITNRRKMTKR